jgi:Xaa-Pro aminopeptidase
VSAVRCQDALPADLRRLVAGGRRLLSAGANPAATDTLVAALRAQGTQYADVSALLAALRVVKDTSEIRKLRAAATITAESVRDASGSIRAGRNEGDVAAAILAGFRARGAMHASFPSIVAAGESALTLHYNANARPLGADELILMDVGAEYARYAGDVTRTYPVSGRFTERQRALYELVLGAQQATIAAVAPGVAPATLNTVARDYLRVHSNGLCGSVTCDQRLVHSVWHWLGLNVHDVGSFTTLQPGMVLTIEPGIYLVPDSIGIRIEDDVLVTAAGREVLSIGAPRTVAEIEALFRATGADSRAR